MLHIQLTMSFFTQQSLPDGSFMAVQEIVFFNQARNHTSAIIFPIKLMTAIMNKQSVTNTVLEADAP